MRWTVHGERPLFRDTWLELWEADVGLPDGTRIDHKVLRMAPVAAAVVLDADRVLMMWRHRFITDTWGWELPAGIIDQGEEPIVAAAREVEEETGYRPNPLEPLITAEPGAGIMDTARLAEVSQHRAAGVIDLLIAATAEHYGATVLHYDAYYEHIAAVTGQPMRWVAAQGSPDVQRGGTTVWPR